MSGLIFTIIGLNANSADPDQSRVLWHHGLPMYLSWDTRHKWTKLKHDWYTCTPFYWVVSKHRSANHAPSLALGDWMHFVDFPPFCTREVTFVTFCLRSCTSSPSGMVCTLTGKKLFLFRLDTFSEGRQAILLIVSLEIVPISSLRPSNIGRPLYYSRQTRAMGNLPQTSKLLTIFVLKFESVHFTTCRFV